MKKIFSVLILFFLITSIVTSATEPLANSTITSYNSNQRVFSTQNPFPATIVYDNITGKIYVSTTQSSVLYIATYSGCKLESLSTHSLVAGTINAAYDFSSSQKAFVWNEDYIPLCPMFCLEGDDNSSSTVTYVVSFDLNYENATVAPANQNIIKDNCATAPETPEREGFAFVGWYVDNTYAELFNFSTPITNAYTLVARWVDVTDTTDTDEDGLTNPIEEYYGTDKTKTDTDEDGLTDIFEIKILKTNPLAVDSDENGTNDADEDFDEDGLNNLQEQTINCNPYSNDTDMDGLTDYNEINTYNTNPNVEDTDEDGLADGDEVALGLDPLIKKTDGITLDSEKLFSQTLDNTNISESLLAEGNFSKPSLSMLTSGNIDSTTTITVANNESLINNTAIVGSPVCVNSSSDMSLGTAIISFEIDKVDSAFLMSDGDNSEEKNPYIICKYYEDEDSINFIPLDSVYNNGVVSAPIDSGGTYFVLEHEQFLNNLGIDVHAYIDSYKQTNSTISPYNFTYSEAHLATFLDSSSNTISPFSDSDYIYVGTLHSGAYSVYYNSTYKTYYVLDWDFINESSVMNELSEINLWSVNFEVCVGHMYIAGTKYEVLHDHYRNEYFYYEFYSDWGEPLLDPCKIYIDTLKDSIIFTNNSSGKYTILLDTFEAIQLDKEPVYGSTADSDKDGILDRKELTSKKTVDISYYVKKTLDANGLSYDDYIEAGGRTQGTVWSFKSRPDMIDSDFDGFKDNEDKEPLLWNISDRDLALCASIVYSSIQTGCKIDSLSANLSSEVKEILRDVASATELKNWEVIDTWNSLFGGAAIALKKDSNIVLAYRGTNNWLDWVGANIPSYISGLNSQTGGAKNFAEKVMKNNKNSKFYITGHSLGGNLAYNAAAKGIKYKESAIQDVVTFNGLGFTPGIFLVGDMLDETTLRQKSSSVRNYSVYNDPVSQGFLELTSVHVGKVIMQKQSNGAEDAHDMYTFLDNLELYNRN